MGTPIEDRLHAALGGRWSARPLHASGFCATWRADDARGTSLFVKASGDGDALAAEADGLDALRASATLRVPALAGCASDADGTLLALEWLSLRAPDAGFGARFGDALAALHRAAPLDARFGWRRDNYLGATPQRNRWHADWTVFMRRERLGAMRERLAGHANAELLDAVDALCDALPAWFDDGYGPTPSLIHGDLWSGNWAMLDDGTPVVFDPAVSCSDAEAELAMMELFGAPPDGFWPAYRAAAGLHPGYAKRRGLYQLYHLLNHALLFGGSYASQALATARRLLAKAAAG
jgi:fructosamine-3-kinase